MFQTLLVANRGEIAVRIIRAARELGIKTYAIYSPVDKHSFHVKLADESFALLEENGQIGYLDIEQIIAICKREHIKSIHPGYGFLSESAEFAEKTQDAGIEFIGPSPDIIELLGNKVKSRKEAAKAGLSIPEGSGVINDLPEAHKEAKKIGYPLLVKAVYGGGGMGIQKASSDKELEKAFTHAQAQSLAAFGREEVFLEKYIHQPRHIEFQIIGDKHGNVVHLGERECSIQRRNQKLLEEAPSTAVTSELRKRVGLLVCTLARELGYQNAGTVEFLYQKGKLFFNEINPRIQVEHPVTEMITGKDIVKEQILIAQGDELSFTQEEIEFRGHAIELRITAEDPLANFQPKPGFVKKFTNPGGPDVRFDTAIYEGYTIPDCYDSLIGKLIIGAETREAAVDRAQNALKELLILGVPTTIPFFQQLLEEENFLKGDISINFIEDEKLLKKIEENVFSLASALFAVGLKKNQLQLPELSENWQMKSKLDAIGRE
ncbi:MAG: acetyl-CoA carboxylase biotin carboxylase subunit [Asgard group archaeon]|nr:acetyl-CoA carboxylase biotin carboxylase subunit [Asgard group archaeon]